MKDNVQIQNFTSSAESIDFNKLRVIFRHKWFWIVLIFILSNLAAYLVVRYTKDLYQSESEIKLDVKQDASDLGISELLPERQKINMISGEIETLQSKLFLSRVIDSLNLHVSYFSIGQILNTELYTSSPFVVEYTFTNSSYYNTPFYIEPISTGEYELTIGNKSSKPIQGKFSDSLFLEGITLVIKVKPNASFVPDNSYSFVINSRDALLDYISKNLTVEPIKFDANTIRVSFKDSNPFKARDLVNGIDSIYLAFSHEQKNLANKQKIEWLSNELGALEKQMEAYEHYFENFTLVNRTSDLESDLKRTIELIHKIDSQRFDVSRRLVELNSHLDALSNPELFLRLNQQKMFPEYINRNLEKLQELYFEMDRMKLSYNENTFAFRQKQSEIETLRNRAFTQLTELKEGLLKKQQELNQSKTKLENDFASMPDKTTQYTKKQRFYKLYEEFYLTLMQNKSQFEIAQAGSTPDFKILSTANLPSSPISPNRPMIFGVGFVASIVLNIFFIGILYLANNKINSLYEIERLSVPLLGAVPALRNKNGIGLYIQSHPKSMVSEALRTLRTNLDFFNVHAAKRVIAVSSTVSGEGKSFIALNLCGVMALSRKKVLLLDLDMRKPKDNTYFQNKDKSKGISTILIRKNTWSECLVKSSIDNFDFIPAGPHPPNPSELLLNGEFSQLLEELKTQYDYIIMDTPPVGIVTDGIMAMKNADITIYIFRANYSKKSFIDNLNRIIRINKFDNITSVLNAVPSSSETAYGYGYYEEQPVNWLTSIFKRGA
ncbi:MAG: polysaccharide biosynthesis tyrosine autokinase [Cyclobacteriaceae bacterium]|nr:polysaccharide biosynthesis tyrosine autokinase [Cyclobacteriaceae bacterium]